MSVEQINFTSVFSPTTLSKELSSAASTSDKNTKNQSFAAVLQSNVDELDVESESLTKELQISLTDDYAAASDDDVVIYDQAGKLFPPPDFSFKELIENSEQQVTTFPSGQNVAVAATESLVVESSGKVEKNTTMDVVLAQNELLDTVSATPVLFNGVELKVDALGNRTVSGQAIDAVMSLDSSMMKNTGKELVTVASANIGLQERQLLSATASSTVAPDELPSALQQQSLLQQSTLHPYSATSINSFSHSESVLLSNMSQPNPASGSSLLTTLAKKSVKPYLIDSLTTLTTPTMNTENSIGLSVVQQQSTETNMPKSFFQLTALPGETRWGEDLTNKLQILLQNNQQTAQFHINPKNMGPLDVRIVVGQDQQVSIGFNVQHAHLKEAIDAAMPRLREMLQEQGLNLSNVDVGQRNSDGHDKEHSSEQSVGTDREADSDEQKELLVSDDVIAEQERNENQASFLFDYSEKSLDLFV